MGRSASGWSPSRSSCSTPCSRKSVVVQPARRAQRWRGSGYRKVNAETGEEVPDDHIVKGYEVVEGPATSSSTPTSSSRSCPAATKIDRPRGVRRPRRDRPDLLRQRLLPRARQAAQAVRAAGAGHGGGRQGRHRPVRDAQQAVPRGDPGRWTAASCCRRWCTPTRSSTRAEIDELAGPRRRRRQPEGGRRWPSRSSSRCPADFEPERYHDDYREQVLDADREEGRPARRSSCPRSAAEKPKVVDLMAALEASVKAAKDARPATRRNPPRPGEGGR